MARNEIVVRISLPPWWRRGLAALGGVVVTCAGIAIAAPLWPYTASPYKAGDPLSASALNGRFQQVGDNLNDLNARLAAVEAASKSSGVATGTVVMWAGPNLPAVVPAGWAVCDGGELKQSATPALYGILGVTHGDCGGKPDCFNLPDLRGRAVVGVGKGAGLNLAWALGEKRGAETHQLTMGQMPSHGHGWEAGYGALMWGGPADGPYFLDSVGVGVRFTPNNTSYTGCGVIPQGEECKRLHIGTVLAAGGDQPHPIVQPSLALNYLIKL